MRNKDNLLQDFRDREDKEQQFPEFYSFNFIPNHFRLKNKERTFKRNNSLNRESPSNGLYRADNDVEFTRENSEIRFTKNRKNEIYIGTDNNTQSNHYNLKDCINIWVNLSDSCIYIGLPDLWIDKIGVRVDGESIYFITEE